jgi:CRP/FNR family transcriptional regulator, cyclic AMP receptor protein
MAGRVRAANHLGLDDLKALTDQGIVKAYPRNAVIVNEGDDTDAFYVIVSGRVKVYASDDDGREIVLTTQEAGDYFGELVLDGGPRSASVMTLEPSRLAVITKPRFRQFLTSHPSFASQLVERLIARVRDLTSSVKSLALMDVYGRVARLMLDLAVEENGKWVVAEKLTQQEIADRVGSSREMVSRIFKDLTAGRYISIDKMRITIHRQPPRHW